ncbi:putative ankyrin repeat protein [Lasiodiplodia theobromae]|uniref:Ankyrin repeat protein n=1 Tax=Lasiodiplodia theobromae TaxID=45133 RepID=A0A8H7IU16_9PEZI|nr:putative ankyrin repeat protein [Lasiodiplodia theobromae]
MEPTSVISVAGACLTVVLRTSREINELVAKARRIDHTVTLILARLSTIQATVSQLRSWMMQNEEEVSPQVAADLHTAIGACQMVVREILRHVQRVKTGWLGGRVRHLWDEGQYLMYQQSLDSQTAALAIFLNVILLKSSTRQRMLLESIESQRTLRDAQDRASIYCPSEYQEEDEQAELPGASSSGNSSTLFSSVENDLFEPRPGSVQSGTNDGSESTTATISTNSTSSSNGFDAEIKKSRRSWLGLRRPTSSSSSTKQQLCDAAFQGDAAIIARLCDEGADVNVRHSRWPSTSSSGRISRWSSTTLASSLESVDKPPPTNRPPSSSSAGSLSKYLSWPSKPSTTTTVETSPLHLAASMGHLDVIDTLITRGGANPNLTVSEGRTPLHLADEDAVPLLLSLGADPLARNAEGQLPLHCAAAAGHLKAVLLYLQHRSPPHPRNPRDHPTSSIIDTPDSHRLTPLHAASAHGRTPIVAALLAAGAYRNAADDTGQRPLHLAAQAGAVGVVEALLGARADRDAAAGKERRTPLHVAAGAGQVGVVEVLLGAGCRVRGGEDAGGAGAVHVAVEGGHVGVLRVLLRAAAGEERGDGTEGQKGEGRKGERVVDARMGRRAERPLHLAARSARADDAVALVRVLLEYGAEVVDEVGGVVVDQAGQSPLTVACARPAEALDVVKVLLAAGVPVRHVDYRALWRNEKLRAWEKTAVHAALNEFASEDLRRDEVEWAIVAV